MSLPEVTFGPPGSAPMDWRKKKNTPDLDKDDDEELSRTPEDVIKLLGFDPLKP